MRASRRLKEIYYFHILFAFAAALIIIFEPVFFYRQGIALHLIALYYALHYLLYVFLMPFGASFAARFGLEKSLATSIPLFVIYFLVLALLPAVPQLFNISWIILTLFKIFYWPAYHASVCQFGDKKNRGTEISWFYAIERGLGVLGPAVGGIVIVYFGFPALFIIAVVVAMFSVVPLLSTKEKLSPVRLSYSAPWRFITSRQHHGLMLGNIGWGEDLVELVFWPIWIIAIVGSESILGLIGTVSALVMAVFGFFVGEMSDRVTRRHVLRRFIPLMVIGYILRIFALGPIRIFITDIIDKIAFIGVRVPLWHKVYQTGAKVNSLPYVTAVEMVLAISKTATATSLFFVFYFLPVGDAFIVTYLLAALLSFFYFAI